MKVLMFGWEFPPFHSGGLGTACYGLTKGLSNNGVDVAFVMPRIPEGAKAGFVRLLSASVELHTINTPLAAYMTAEEYRSRQGLYGRGIFSEARSYALRASAIAGEVPHDVIHAHDWMTYQAGINAKRVSGKPLVVHVHATEFDRTGGSGINQFVYDLERKGMHEADAIIAVSNFTKQKIVEHYGVHPGKVHVVHNAVEFNENRFSDKCADSRKVVLFLGRITLQKGPEYFLHAARRVLELEPNVLFVMAGDGDMYRRVVEQAASLGIGDRVLFTGFLRGSDIDRAYQMADVYVMPSVSEPFGITPLEAMRNSTPVIISKQSGVSEVVHNCLKADFWDIDRMANQIVGLLRYKEAHGSLARLGAQEVHRFSWDIPAGKCLDVYNLLAGGS